MNHSLSYISVNYTETRFYTIIRASCCSGRVFNQCGESYEFTFDTKGVLNYEDTRTRLRAQIVVIEKQGEFPSCMSLLTQASCEYSIRVRQAIR